MRGNRAAFTLVELALLVLIIGIVTATLVTMIPGQTQREARTVTKSHLAEIVAALESFKAREGYYPCVASRTELPNTANYGRQVLANCVTDTSTPAGTARVDSGGGAYVRFGVVPTRDLALSDRYMADEFGNRYTYVVTEGLTSAATFAATAGKLTILDAAGATLTAEGGYALISHGKDGQGAYRELTGALKVACGATANLDVENCDGDVSFRAASYSESTTEAIYYDDFINYASKASASTCVNNDPPITWHGIVTLQTEGFSNPSPGYAVGDFNDDDIDDLVVSGSGGPYVVYGKSAGWPNGYLLGSLTAASTGFEITGGGTNTTGRGDMNGDGVEDMVFSSGNDVAVIFGKSAGWADTQTVDSLAVSPTGFKVTNMATRGWTCCGYQAWGNVNGDAYDDLIIEAYSEIVVVFGKAVWGNTLDATTLDGTNGFTVKVPYAVTSENIKTPPVTGDLDDDGFDDIILNYSSNMMASSVIFFGKANGFDASYQLDYAPGPIVVPLAANMVKVDNLGALDSISSGKDVNNDGIEDVMFDSSLLLYGRTDWPYGMAAFAADLADDGGGIGVGINSGDKFFPGPGGALADLNGDDCVDMVGGRPDEGPSSGWPGNIHDGAVYTVFGSNTLSDIYDAAAEANGTDGFKVTGRPNEYDQLGYEQFAVGDFDDDGIDDVVVNVGVGSYFLYVIYGKNTAWSADHPM